MLNNISSASQDKDKKMEERNSPYVSDYEGNSEDEDQQEEKFNGKHQLVEFIRDPSKRLYYYVDHSK